MTNKKILIVDDELVGRQLLQALLIMEGYETILAETGHKALELIEKSIPDLILLDVMMPEIDGFAVAKKLKANDKLKNIPIIFVSALDDRDSRIEGLSTGAEDYISKPYNGVEVIKKIKNTLAGYSILEEHASNLNNFLNDNTNNAYALIKEALKDADSLNILKESIDFTTNNLSIESNLGIWSYSSKVVEYICLYGPTKPDKTSAFYNALLASYHWRLSNNTPNSAEEFSNLIAHELRVSEHFDVSKNPWWHISIFKSNKNISVAGFNQAIFLQQNSEDSSISDDFELIPFNSNNYFDISNNLKIVLFSSNILSHFSNEDLLVKLKNTQETDLNSLNNSFSHTENITDSFIIKLSI